MKYAIEIRNIYKKYKNTADFSVNNISLNIPCGEIFGLLDPKGAGKTTLISMICGLVKPTAGEYRIHQMSPKNHDREIKQIIGIVSQEYALYPSLTARENLTFFGNMYGLHGKTLSTKIDEGLERLGLCKFANRRIEYFSGGMKRRCNLLARLLHDPKVLFLDKPTVGVDVQSRNVIMEFLKEINAMGTDILYTSHHLSEAEYFCNRIAIIDYGKIFACDSPRALVDSVPGASTLEEAFMILTGKELRDVI